MVKAAKPARPEKSGALAKTIMKPRGRASKYEYGNVEYEVRMIKGMKVENGARQWCVAWAGEQPDGTAWPDSWEPSSCVPDEMLKAYLARRKETIARSILVDTSPLDLKVAQVISTAVEKAKVKHKGQQHEIPVLAISLRDIGENYLEAVASQFGCSVDETYDPSDGVTTWQVNITNMETIGKFCSFEQTMVDVARGGKTRRIAAHGIGALRHGGGRKHNSDLSVVGLPLVLKMSDCSRTPGLVDFTVEFPTVWINGKFGTPEIPHMSEGMLKEQENLNAVVQYVRSVIPHSHNLYQKKWHLLPAHKHTLADHVAVPDC